MVRIGGRARKSSAPALIAEVLGKKGPASDVSILDSMRAAAAHLVCLCGGAAESIHALDPNHLLPSTLSYLSPPSAALPNPSLLAVLPIEQLLYRHSFFSQYTHTNKLTSPILYLGRQRIRMLSS